MKKIIFIAAAACIALAGCTKNEPADSVNDSQKEITFSTPVVAPSTKAIIDGVVYPTTESFGVYAWHTSTDAAYMDKVQVSYTSGLADETTGETAGELGGWKPAQSYYWPKEGSLVFDAFSPYSVNNLVSATKDAGITITDFEVAAAADVDLMYATRTAEKTSVNDGTNADIPYDGVDIAFNHALAAVQIQAKTASDYSATTTIAITSIKIVNADSKGTFNQNVSSTAEWTTSAATEYAYTAQTVTTTAYDCGTKLLLPQTFDDDLAIEISYTINGLANTTTFKFADHKTGDNDGTAVIVEGWEMGNKYVYTLVFTLDEIFFEPIVTDWDTITVA